MGWNLHQADVKTVFLNGVIENEVYMKQSEGFIVHEKESHIGRLKKTLYKLKQISKGITFQGLWIFDKLEIYQEGSQPALHGGWR